MGERSFNLTESVRFGSAGGVQEYHDSGADKGESEVDGDLEAGHRGQRHQEQERPQRPPLRSMLFRIHNFKFAFPPLRRYLAISLCCVVIFQNA